MQGKGIISIVFAELKKVSGYFDTGEGKQCEGFCPWDI